MTDLELMIRLMELRLETLPEAGEVLRLLEELRRRRAAAAMLPAETPTPDGRGLRLRGSRDQRDAEG